MYRMRNGHDYDPIISVAEWPEKVLYLENSSVDGRGKLKDNLNHGGANVWVNCIEDNAESCLSCDVGCKTCKTTSNNC